MGKSAIKKNKYETRRICFTFGKCEIAKFFAENLKKDREEGKWNGYLKLYKLGNTWNVEQVEYIGLKEDNFNEVEII